MTEEVLSKRPPIGSKYGRLTILGYDYKQPKYGRKRLCALCKCECGTIKLMDITSIKKGLTVSCGCYNKEQVSKACSKGNLSQTQLYDVWCNMKARCDNTKNPAYHNYGGRGISYCQEWREFVPFYIWAIKSGYTKGGINQSIDRIDVNGDYCPENCRWATYQEQQNNRRDNVRYNVFGLSLTLIEMARIVDIPISAMRSRIYTQKMSPIEAMITPLRNNRNAKRKEKEYNRQVERFRTIVAKISETYRKKQLDYGNSFGRSVEKYGLVAALTRISDKFNRLENIILSHNERHVKDETLTDTLGDMAAYCIMTIIEIENESKNQEAPPRCCNPD